MEREEQHPFVPPKGRQGHSVPTPKPLGVEVPLCSAIDSGKSFSSTSNQPLFPKLDSWPTTDLQHSGSSSGSSTSVLSPAQFYAHRDHVFGGSLSKLDRMRSYQDSIVMEAFDETEEYEDTDFSEESTQASPVRKASTADMAEVSHKASTSVSGRGTNMSLDKLTGDSLLFFSYSAASGGSGLSHDPQLGGSFVRAFTQGLDTSLSIPYVQCTSPVGGVGSGDQFPLFPTAARNPNKAIITIDAQSSRILVANEMTCELFGFQPVDLSGMKIQNLFTEPYRGKQRALMEQNISIWGETVHISGKVMDAVTSYGIEFPVSVWMRKVGGSKKTNSDSAVPQPQAPPTPRVIVVIEPVERSSALFSLDAEHRVASCDPWFACLFGFQDSSEIIGKKVRDLIPSLTLPTAMEELSKVPSKQGVTGRAKGGTVFPLTVKFTNVSQSLSIGDLYSPTHTSQHQSSSINDSKSSAPPSSSNPTTSSSHVDHSLSYSADPTSSSSGVYSTSTSLSPAYTDPSLSPSSTEPSHSSVSHSSTEPSHSSVSHSSTDPSHSSASPSCTDPSQSPSTDPSPSTDHTPSESDSSPSTFPGPEYINAKAVVYAALSGMISFFLDGTIHGCNHHFALMLFGYTQQELLKKDITFLLPDFYHHVGFVDDRSMPLPPVDEEDFLFHSVAERSLSPDKASDFIKNLQDGLSSCKRSPRHHQQLRLLSPSRKKSPLHFPDNHSDTTEGVGAERDGLTSPLSEAAVNSFHTTTVSHTDDSISTISNRTIGQSTSCDPEQMSCDPSSVSHMESDDDIPSVASIGSNQRDLPPVPNRLVPSQSTERILDILSQHGLGTESGSDQKAPPLSSTPATKARDSSMPSHNSSMSSQLSEFSLTSQMSIQEGTFLGDAKHKDGSLMAVVFQLKRITLADGQDIYCMWVSRDLDMQRARNADLSMSMSRPLPDPYGQHMVVSPEVDIDGGVETTDGPGPSRHNPSGPALWPSQQQQQQAEDLIAMEGEYSLSYTTLKAIGKGAFGFVRIAQKIDDNSLVVVKFLRKSSVLKDCWVSDREMGVVPLEIALLARLSHTNIVQVLEAYENEHFFQMVMEKHGDGLDLFEFIERGPKLTEKHISHMFRQVISALDYLHGKDIVHRDIKDENIIIDQQFHIKLIDFGSAAYMAPGKKFNTFCGTLEYCSPEVLLGNSYAGPELEMWAVGVTLYTLVFGENPFFDVEETISGHLQPPFLTSPALMKVLFWLLHPDPRSRATITDLQGDKWTNQPVGDTQLSFDAVFGHVATDGPVPARNGMGNVMGGPVKCSSEGKAVELSKSMVEQLVMSEKEGKREISDR